MIEFAKEYNFDVAVCGAENVEFLRHKHDYQNIYKDYYFRDKNGSMAVIDKYVNPQELIDYGVTVITGFVRSK